MAPFNRTLTKIVELNNTTTFKNFEVLNNVIHSHFCKTKTLQLSPMVSQLSLGQYSFQIESFSDNYVLFNDFQQRSVRGIPSFL